MFFCKKINNWWIFGLCCLLSGCLAPLAAQKNSQSFPLRRAYILPAHKFGQKWLNAECGIGLGIGYKTKLFGTQLQFAHRFRSAPLWTLGVETGFWEIAASNAFQNTHFANSQHQLFPLIARADWHGGRRFLYGAGIGVGLAWVLGFEKRLLQADQSFYVYTPSAALLAASIRWSGFVGYRCSKRWSLRLGADYLRVARKHSSDLRVYAPSQNQNPSTYKVLDTYRLGFWAISLTVRMRLYKSLYPHTKTKEGIIYH